MELNTSHLTSVGSDLGDNGSESDLDMDAYSVGMLEDQLHDTLVEKEHLENANTLLQSTLEKEREEKEKLLTQLLKLKTEKSHLVEQVLHLTESTDSSNHRNMLELRKARHKAKEMKDIVHQVNINMYSMARDVSSTLNTSFATHYHELEGVDDEYVQQETSVSKNNDTNDENDIYKKKIYTPKKASDSISNHTPGTTSTDNTYGTNTTTASQLQSIASDICSRVNESIVKSCEKNAAYIERTAVFPPDQNRNVMAAYLTIPRAQCTPLRSPHHFRNNSEFNDSDSDSDSDHQAYDMNRDCDEREREDNSFIVAASSNHDDESESHYRSHTAASGISDYLSNNSHLYSGNSDGIGIESGMTGSGLDGVQGEATTFESRFSGSTTSQIDSMNIKNRDEKGNKKQDANEKSSRIVKEKQKKGIEKNGRRRRRSKRWQHLDRDETDSIISSVSNPGNRSLNDTSSASVMNFFKLFGGVIDAAAGGGGKNGATSIVREKEHSTDSDVKSHEASTVEDDTASTISDSNSQADPNEPADEGNSPVTVASSGPRNKSGSKRNKIRQKQQGVYVPLTAEALKQHELEI